MWKNYLIGFVLGMMFWMLITFFKGCGRTSDPEPIVFHDTIVRVDTAYLAAKTKVVYKTKFDTLVVRDTVKEDGTVVHDTIAIEIPIEHKLYADSFITDSSRIDLTVKFSGYHAKIDSVGLGYNFTIDPQVVEKKKGFGWCVMPSVNVGYGLGVYEQSPVFTPYIGVGVSIGWGYHW